MPNGLAIRPPRQLRGHGRHLVTADHRRRQNLVKELEIVEEDQASGEKPTE